MAITDERYKKIMEDLGYPNSISIMLALKQVANEVEQSLMGERKLNSTNDITFGSAIDEMKKGYKIARKGWNGADMYVELIGKRTVENSAANMFEVPYLHYREYMQLKTADSSFATWAPSGSDALAEDWFIVGEE